MKGVQTCDIQIVPNEKNKGKDTKLVKQKAQQYVNGIKLMNEAIVDNINTKNQKIIQKLTRKA